MAHYLDQKTGEVSYIPGEPAQTTASASEAVQSGGEPKQQRTVPPKNNFSSDNIETRQVLNALGFENSEIGFDGTNVTYKNNYLLKPTENNNGVTKTSLKGVIDGVNNYRKSEGSDDYIVDVTSYAATNTQLPYAVKYHENGTVTVGGEPIENVIIIDGNSYAPKSAIEAAVNKFKQNTGYTTHMELANKHLSETQEMADMYLNKINNYAPFAYDPQSDPVYKAYEAMYTRNAKAAQENTLHINNARTGGYTNTAAITAGNQAYYNHMAALADRVPELEANAYARYKDQYNMLWQGLSAYGTPVDRYSIAANANAAGINALYNALEADYQRDIDNYKMGIDDRDFAYQAEWDAWQRDNIYLPQSLSYWQAYNHDSALNPILLAQEDERLKGLQFDNRAMAKKYGFKY